jgi:excinuclease UvrABC nuclease subunit
MAKVSDQERHLYFEKAAPYRATIEAILNREKKQLLVVQKNPVNAAFKRIALVEDMLNLASYDIMLNGVSLSVL